MRTKLIPIIILIVLLLSTTAEAKINDLGCSISMKKYNVYCENIDFEYYEMWTHDTGNSDRKTYMDYRAITNTASKQWQLQQDEFCWVDDRGFLKYRDHYYVVAMGTYWGNVGDKFLVHLENGQIIPVIIGDIKADRHTDIEHYADADGHVLEFLIDTSNSYMIQSGVVRHGLLNVALPDEFGGRITSICKERLVVGE